MHAGGLTYTIEATATTFTREDAIVRNFVPRIFINDHLVYPLDKEEIEMYDDADDAINRGFDWVRAHSKGK